MAEASDTSTAETNSYFYYDEGKRVPLVESQKWLLAHREACAKTLGEERFNALLASGATLTDKFGLILCAELSPMELELLEDSDAVEPLFGEGSTLFFPLAELLFEHRITREQLAYANSLDIALCEPEKGQHDSPFVLHVRSGRGLDALAISNRLHEKFKRLDVAPSFMRLQQHLPPTRL